MIGYKTDIGTDEQWRFHQSPSREVRFRFVVSHTPVATERESQCTDRPSDYDAYSWSYIKR